MSLNQNFGMQSAGLDKISDRCMYELDIIAFSGDYDFYISTNSEDPRGLCPTAKNRNFPTCYYDPKSKIMACPERKNDILMEVYNGNLYKYNSVRFYVSDLPLDSSVTGFGPEALQASQNASAGSTEDECSPYGSVCPSEEDISVNQFTTQTTLAACITISLNVIGGLNSVVYDPESGACMATDGLLEENACEFANAFRKHVLKKTCDQFEEMEIIYADVSKYNSDKMKPIIVNTKGTESDICNSNSVCGVYHGLIPVEYDHSEPPTERFEEMMNLCQTHSPSPYPRQPLQ